ncbi:MAG: hypothetical protein WBP45_01670 [Daejeonella sp.]
MSQLINSLKTGQCPKCGGKDIYSNEGLETRGDRCVLVVSLWKALYVKTLICIQCGWFEDYAVLESKGIEKVIEHWKKI